MTTPRELPELPCVFWRAAKAGGGYMYFDHEPTHLPNREGMVLASDYAALAARFAEVEADSRELRQLCRDMLPVFEAARPLVLNLERLKDAVREAEHGQ